MGRYEFSEALSAQLNVDNLLDETYYSQIGFYDQLAFGEPRNVSLHLRYTFQARRFRSHLRGSFGGNKADRREPFRQRILRR